MQVFLISLPIFLIIFSGWLLKKYKIVTDDWIHILNQFAYYVALPALIITSFWAIDFTDKNSWQIVYWSLFIVSFFSLLILAALSFIKIRTSLKAAIFLCATAGNTVYMGLPLVEMGFGGQSLEKGALISVIFLVTPLLVAISVIKYWHDKKHEVLKQLISFIKNPLVVSVTAGFLLSYIRVDWEIISSVKKALSIVGATAPPIALFALGGFLYGKFLKKDLGVVFVSSTLKLLGFSALAFIIGSVFKIQDFGIYTLLGAMPVAVTAFVIAEEFNLEKDIIGNTILISTILSFFVIPFILFLI
ncbi:MAG: hypothetical protein DDT19_02018 [Syntrophomonadaceae bacterium]|nr:hypothetical protein [Bacillota bacterium]